MMLLIGLVVWLLVTVAVLRFFAAASDGRRLGDLNKKDKDAK